MNIKMSIAAAALALSAPAFAAENTPTATVKYGDINLASDTGVAQLSRRVQRAAVQLCGVVPARDMAERKSVSECQSDVIADASTKLQPVLAAAGQGGTELALNLVRRAR
jgi:UrcA family protein